MHIWGFPGDTEVKNPPASAGEGRDVNLIPGSRVRRFPRVGNGQPTPVFLPGIFHGQRSLAGNSSWGRKELHMTE